MSNCSNPTPLLLLTSLFAVVQVAAAAPLPPASTPLSWSIEQRAEEPRSATGGFSIDPAQRETARLFFQTVFMSSEAVPAGWTGNVASCTPGTLSSDYQEATIRRVNWFRAMAGVPATVVLDTTFSTKAQQAALMMSAQGQLSHEPPTNWACYTSEGAEAAGNSNLSLGNAGPDAVYSQVRDQGGSNYPVGHRRWILYPQTERMGAGSIPGGNGAWAANALWVFDDKTWEPRPSVRDTFVAWPPPGYAPYQTVYPRWSFSLKDADFSSATVSMTKGGQSIGVTQEPLDDRFGENTLVWLPSPYQDGDTWSRPASDETYQVTISNVQVDGASQDYSYQVTVFDPEVKGADYQQQTIRGPDTMQTGETADFDFTTLAVADSYQWRQATSTPYLTVADAESGLGDLVAETSAGYSVISTARAAAGNASFHLVHPEAVDRQTLTFDLGFLPDTNPAVVFSSWFGWTSENQIASVEISEDQGNSWTPIWQDANAYGPSSSPFSTETVSLNDYAGRAVWLRFSYAYIGGVYYSSSDGSSGWFIDDIVLQGTNALSFGTVEPTDTASSFRFSPTAAGSILLQVQPLVFGGFAGEWSPFKAVSVTSGGAIPADYENQVFTLFIGYFGRPPAPAGAEYFGGVMDDSNGNWAIIADDFWNSSESQELYSPELSTRDKINLIYNNLFSRDAESDGLDYWEGLINSGVVSLPEMAYTIAYNASADDLAILDAKRTTADRWTTSLDTAEEVAAFETDAGKQAARDFLYSVASATPASQTAVDQAIADMVAAQ